MQVLIVDRDADLGAQLVQMVKEYSGHDCAFVRSSSEAFTWAQTHRRCDFLLTQLDGAGIDGLALGGSLSERFPKLQTAFLPAYAASEQRLELRDTKVFPEPIDGERLLEMIARAETAERRDVFHPVDVLQMCCLSRKTGAIQMVNSGKTALLFLRKGELIHAETESRQGQEALVELLRWNSVEFAYDPSVRSDVETISAPWNEILVEAVRR